MACSFSESFMTFCDNSALPAVAVFGLPSQSGNSLENIHYKF